MLWLYYSTNSSVSPQQPQPSLRRLDYTQKLVQHTASALPCSQLIVYLLTELVPAQRAGIPAHQAGASPASRYTFSPSWSQPTQ
ncbi:hypothetical protein PCASD_06976 [Puccinia coronata f. sp. avenae]|uniref:Uncharacterized protein n=1 Tax=Puccinia coronata f. sp. avenae TaxID=200324 RepID=A0A2N5T4V7_9BASI|nr:hypothetical protein PCASD_15572 [Puccinia coronata f. sp. avenae]PLW45014.1 hypothetical protein PCASD_06976 [Puccinia coronata f. sp. avenae]